MKDWREKIKGGGQERWNMRMWRKLLGAALLWQANWSSVWQRTLSCHSNEEPICCLLQGVCWILMMLQKAQTTDRHCVTETPPPLSLPPALGHTAHIPFPSPALHRLYVTGSKAFWTRAATAKHNMWIWIILFDFVNLSSSLIHDNVILDSAGSVFTCTGFPLLD